MADLDYNIRNYRSSDLEGCVHIWLIEGHDQTGHCTSPQIVEMRLQKPGFTLEETVLVAEKDGNIFGCLNITLELARKHAVVHCTVHPEHRRQNIATALINKAVERIVDMGATVASTDILENNPAAKNLLHKLGFKPVRRFIEMQMALDNKPTGTASPSMVIRHLAQNEEAALADLQNRAFAQHWGYNPNTVEEITYQLKQGNGSYQNVILACVDNKPAAYCWTTPITKTNSTTGKKHGSILMLGVDPDYQSKSIGKAVLIAGLSSLFDRGVEVVEITADSVNEKALALYKSAGFQQQAISQCYEKVLA
ncbi:GNAT family N-acetyltransferase [Chloroflexota bacterium]